MDKKSDSVKVKFDPLHSIVMGDQPDSGHVVRPRGFEIKVNAQPLTKGQKNKLEKKALLSHALYEQPDNGKTTRPIIAEVQLLDSLQHLKNGNRNGSVKNFRIPIRMGAQPDGGVIVRPQNDVIKILSQVQIQKKGKKGRFGAGISKKGI